MNSNYALVKDLDQKERTPAPDRARFADESAITAGRVDPMTVSELRHSPGRRVGGSPISRRSPIHEARRVSRSPHEYDDYEKEMLRRERLDRNRQIGECGGQRAENDGYFGYWVSDQKTGRSGESHRQRSRTECFPSARGGEPPSRIPTQEGNSRVT